MTPLHPTARACTGPSGGARGDRACMPAAPSAPLPDSGADLLDQGPGQRLGAAHHAVTPKGGLDAGSGPVEPSPRGGRGAQRQAARRGDQTCFYGPCSPDRKPPRSTRRDVWVVDSTPVELRPIHLAWNPSFVTAARISLRANLAGVGPLKPDAVGPTNLDKLNVPSQDRLPCE